jgi:hypothetical protein
MSSIRGDIPIGRQMRKDNQSSAPATALSRTLISCNSLDQRIAALENEVDDDGDEDSGESGSESDDESKHIKTTSTSKKRTLPPVPEILSKAVKVTDNLLMETDANGNVIKLMSSLAGTVGYVTFSTFIIDEYQR